MAGFDTKNWRRSAMLGVALAAFALPAAAMAQDADGHGRHGGRGDGEAAGQIGEQHSWRQAAQVQQQADGGERQQRTWAPRAAPEAQVQAQARTQADARGGWRGREAGAQVQVQAAEHGNFGGWRNRGDDGARAQAQAQAQARSEQPRGWTGRNGTYTDPQRNSSYTGRDGYRDTRTAYDGRDRRDGSRSGSGDQWRREGTRYSYSGSHQTWSRDWRRDNRYDWSSYRNRNRSIFNIGIYYSPYRNYSYRRLSIGFFLDSLFYSDRYWINDPWQYRLPEVYGPYRWVRYYDDALLVDIYSGEVVDTIYDFFY